MPVSARISRLKRVEPHTLTSVFRVLRLGVHALFVGLLAIVALRALVLGLSTTPVVLSLSAALLVVYGFGAVIGPVRARSGSRAGAAAWLAVLTALWFALMLCSPEAAYIAIPLFFLFVHLLRAAQALTAILAATAAAVVTIGLRDGWTFGGVVGPLVAAGIALLIGFGGAAIARQNAERDALIAELIDTRDQLAVSQHESGVLAERSRLAREIHDTLAQGLASIQMLLHAAERADPHGPGVEHIRLARDTAQANLADARRFIRELSAPSIEERGLGGTLRRLVDTEWRRDGLRIEVRVADTLDAPMSTQTALLRIAQGAMANVVSHASAHLASIAIDRTGDTVRLVVVDDGVGFEPELVLAGQVGRPDSFGLRATRERVDQLDGTMSIAASPGRGTRLSVELPVAR